LADRSFFEITKHYKENIMSVLVYLEANESGVKRTSLEAIAMASQLSKNLGADLQGVTFESGDAFSKVSGPSKVYQVQNDKLEEGNVVPFAIALEQVVKQIGATVVVMPNSSLCEAAVSRLAVKLNASVMTNVIGLPDTSNGFVVTKGVYTGKAFATFELNQDIKLLTVKKNSFEFEPEIGESEIEIMTVDLSGSEIKAKITEVQKTEGKILLPDADLVVSAGRGLKDAENWRMIEELADVLGGATACSKPVADVGWRPHHEHVGQTGLKVSPNLYIAVGISGAIQHLAGVSSSKVIVVINTDEEAPFFKAADYGIVGDAFDVVPKMIEILKK
jgi:electron transfer flavoprotein alpha subunit